MYKLLSKNRIKKTLALILISLTFQSCFNNKIYNEIYVENDVVYGTKRFELKHYIHPQNSRSAIKVLIQDIIKEIDSNNEVSYTAYDYLELNSSSFKIDEKVFYIIDNVAYPMTIDHIEFDNVRKTTENKSDVLTADSTTVSVVTGYSEQNRKTIKFKYNIPVLMMEKIKEARQLSIRYYSGPSMATFHTRQISLGKMIELIDSE